MPQSKMLTVIGTRPEAIKLAPVVLELERRPDKFVSRVCVTAQHRAILDQPLALFGIAPDYDLNIMSPGQTLAQVTARAMEGLDRVLTQDKRDLVLTQGDTTTFLCGALASIPAGVCLFLLSLLLASWLLGWCGRSHLSLPPRLLV